METSLELDSKNSSILLGLLEELYPDKERVVWKSKEWDYTAADLARAIRKRTPAGKEWARGMLLAGNALVAKKEAKNASIKELFSQETKKNKKYRFLR